MVLLLAGLTLLSGMASGFAIFYFLFYAFVGAVVGGLLWASANLIGIRISAQRRPGIAKVGDYAETELYVENRSLLPKILLEVQDMVELPGQVTGTVLNLPPYQNFRWHARALLNKRGVYPLGPARVFSSDLLGLFRLQRTFHGVEEVMVYPATVELPFFQLSVSDGIHQGVRHQHTQGVTPSVSTVREYSDGDSLRRIHWPSSIRTGQLMVKEFERELGNQVWIVLDLDRDVQAGGEIDNTEESSITVAASIARKFMTMNRPVGFIAHGDQRYFLSPQRNPAAHDRLLGMLAVARADGRVPLAEVLREARAQIGPFIDLVIITPSAKASSLQELDAWLGRRLRTAVVLIDAYSFGGDQTAEQAQDLLQRNGHLTYAVRRGDELGTALDHRAAVNGNGSRKGYASSKSYERVI